MITNTRMDRSVVYTTLKKLSMNEHDGIKQNFRTIIKNYVNYKSSHENIIKIERL